MVPCSMCDFALSSGERESLNLGFPYLFCNGSTEFDEFHTRGKKPCWLQMWCQHRSVRPPQPRQPFSLSQVSATVSACSLEGLWVANSDVVKRWLNYTWSAYCLIPHKLFMALFFLFIWVGWLMDYWLKCRGPYSMQSWKRDHTISYGLVVGMFFSTWQTCYSPNLNPVVGYPAWNLRTKMLMAEMTLTLELRCFMFGSILSVGWWHFVFSPYPHINC